jgi:hypothetical protein
VVLALEPAFGSGSHFVNSHRLGYQSQVFFESPTIGRLLEDLPAVRHALFVEGAPRGFIGRRYLADPTLTLLQVKGIAQILRFGSSGLGDAVGIDFNTGHVLEIIKAPDPVSVFVNTSVRQFTETVKAMIGKFPYYDSVADENKIITVANELGKVVQSIDPEAGIPDRYWSTFIDDVEMGDLSTEAILAVIDRER